MKKLNWLVWLMTLSAVFIVCTNSITDSDFWWHLKTGEYIWQTKSVPHKDVFSHTAAGRVWTVHEWLAEVILYLVYKIGGFDGVVYFTALIAVTTFAIIGLILRTRKVPDLVSQSVIFLGAVVAAPFFTSRPQIFYFLFWVVLILILSLCEKNKRVAWFIPLLFLVWANFHVSINLPILLIGLYLFGKLVISWPEWGTFFKQHRVLLGATLAGCLLALANPNTYRIYIYILKTTIFMMGKNPFEIKEWGPMWAPWGSLATPAAWRAWFFIVFYLLVLLSFLLNLKKKAKRKVFEEAVVVFPLILVSFPTSKFLSIALLSALPFFGVNLSQILEGRRKPFGIHPIISFCLAFTYLGLAGVYHYFLAGPIKSPWENYPRRATEFVLENKIAGQMYNHYNQGGFLIWLLYPQYKVFIDGRYEMFDPDIIEDFITVGEGGEDWEEPLVKYGVNFLLLSPKDVHPGLAISENWVMVYFDNYAAIYIKNASENQALIEKFGYKVIRPFLPTVQVNKGKESEAISEYERSLEQNPDNFKAHYDLGVIYINLEKYSRCEEHLRESIKVFPKSARSHYNLAFCLEKQGKLEEAEKEYLEYQFLTK